MKKIFLVTPTLEQGGAERVIVELANEFSRFGDVEIHLVLLAVADDFYAVSEKVIIHRLGFRNEGFFFKILSQFKTLIKLRKILKNHRPYTILSFQERFNSLTIIASFFLKIPVYISDRSNPLKRLSGFNECLRSITYIFAAGIIAQTNFSKLVISKKTINKNIRVIPNPIKKINFYPIKREKIILNVGRLVPEKGQRFLIEAFARLKISDWKLVILGEGPLREKLENQISILGMESNVLMPGSVKDVDYWMARASIFAFPSISEGFPNALLEAMSAGLPCVSFDCDSGPRDIITHGETGYLIESGRVNKLSSCLMVLVEDPMLRNRIGKNARKRTFRYERNTIIKEFFDFINGN